jgi:S1-C subfamily serine protease
MSRWNVIALALLPGLLLPAAARGDEPELPQALALQKVIQKLIVDAEPAIACILVSRSDAYEEYGQGPSKERPGKLGGLNVEQLKKNDNFLRITGKDPLQELRKLDLSDPHCIPASFGSGVVIDAAGLVLTNYHVVQDATKVFVRLAGGKGSYADIHAADPRSDLAVLKLITPDRFPLQTITLGNADKATRGTFVITLANPFAAGFRDGQPSASWGILSNVRRRPLQHLREEERVKPLTYYATLLETDARLHLGCSGGALLNLHGEMIGLLTATAAIQGGETPGGYALPINSTLRRIIDVLKRGEEVEYGFLGIAFEDKLSKGRNHVSLTAVPKGTPAAVQGRLAEGDELLAVNGQPLQDSDDIFITIGSQLAGDKVRLLVRHDGKERTAEVTLAKLYVPGKKIASSDGSRPFVRGLRVDYTSLLVQHVPRLGAVPPGVYVSEVQANTSAERARLKSGDIVTHVNQTRVDNPAEFYAAMAAAVGPVELTLYNFQNPDPPRLILK